jgi:uncharacterized protein (TIGR02996 family)
MDSRELALLETIHAHPGEDAPRLVYADWLEEHGDTELAEFIRVQIERAERDEFDAAQKGLARRERELIDARCSDWVGPALRALVGYQAPADEPPLEPLDQNRTRYLPPETRWQFRRGFPWVEVSAGQFLSHVPLIVDSAWVVQVHIGPDSTRELVQRVRVPGSLRPRRDVFQDLLAAPLLSAAAGLGLTLTEESDWEELKQLPASIQVTALHSRGTTAYRWHLRELDRPGLAKLNELSLHYMSLTDPAADELAACPSLERLRTLDLRGNHITPQGVVALSACVVPQRLRTLDLSDNPIGDAGAVHLAQWPGLAAVRVLRLAGCGLTHVGAAALAASPHLGNLTQLNLRRNEIRGPGVAALIRNDVPWLDRLAHLDLCGNRIGSQGARELIAASQALPNLRRLCLSNDRDDLIDHYADWLAQAYGERLHLDSFQPGK